ncbi:MAG: YDG domain-containing protein, partial [Candidatus Omnitrophota bacterium]
EVSTLPMTLTGSDIGNYTLAQPAGLAADITAKELTIGGTFTADNKVYDGNTTATIKTNDLTLVTKIGEDVVCLSAVAVFADKTVGTAKVVSLTGSTLTGDDAGNYSLSLVGAPTTTANIASAVKPTPPRPPFNPGVVPPGEEPIYHKLSFGPLFDPDWGWESPGLDLDSLSLR